MKLKEVKSGRSPKYLILGLITNNGEKIELSRV